MHCIVYWWGLEIDSWEFTLNSTVCDLFQTHEGKSSAKADNSSHMGIVNIRFGL